MDKEQVIDLVSRYKQIITPRFDGKFKVYLFGSYSKDCARPESDIDVAVIVPSIGDNWLEWSKNLWHDTRSVSTLIEPVLMSPEHPSPLYDDVRRTGIAV